MPMDLCPFCWCNSKERERAGGLGGRGQDLACAGATELNPLSPLTHPRTRPALSLPVHCTPPLPTYQCWLSGACGGSCLTWSLLPSLMALQTKGVTAAICCPSTEEAAVERRGAISLACRCTWHPCAKPPAPMASSDAAEEAAAREAPAVHGARVAWAAACSTSPRSAATAADWGEGTTDRLGSALRGGSPSPRG